MDYTRRAYWYLKLKMRAMKLGQHARFMRYAALQHKYELLE